MVTKHEITQNIKELVLSKTYVEDGIVYFSMEHYALDFNKRYIFRGFTKKGIKLSENCGANNINVMAFVEEFDDKIKIRADGCSYHLTINKPKILFS